MEVSYVRRQSSAIDAWVNADVRSADNQQVRLNPNRIDLPRVAARTQWFSTLCLAWVATGAVTRESAAMPPVSNDRVVQVFDFDERASGNLEPVPRFWIPFGGEGFPHFATGSFDESVGHDEPPSFRLDSQGRNVAYRYTGDETTVQPQSDYLIVGWIHTNYLHGARASLSGYYLDRDRLPIIQTQQFSDLVSFSKQDIRGWHRVEVFLPAGPPEAKTIGLTAWVVQENVWSTQPKTVRHIVRNDISARAWFDDITIYRLPRVELATSVPGNVLQSGPSSHLIVSVNDTNADQLRAELEVFETNGRRLLSTPIPVHADDALPPTTVDLSGIDNGLFHARIRVYAKQDLLAERSLIFANVTNTTNGDPVGVARSLGVVLDPANRADAATELTMLKMLNVGSLKIPVWSGLADAPDLADAQDATDAMLFELLKARVAITGVFAGPPSDLVRSAGAYPMSLMEMLDDDPTAWRSYLVRIVAPYSSVFRSWQVGRDDNAVIVADPRLPRLINLVRTEMETLTTAPNLTSPGSLTWEPTTDKTGADDFSLTLDSSILPRFIRSHLDEYRDREQHVSSIYLQPSSPAGVDRREQLGDWCKRLVYARETGVETVFVPQPWFTRDTLAGPVTEPTSELVVLRTIVDVIGDATPASPVYVAPGVTALTFNHHDTTVLAMWDDRAGAAERTHEIQLGSATTQIDMFGRQHALDRTKDGRQRVALGTAPTFVRGVEQWLVMFRTLLSFSPKAIELSIDEHDVALTIENPHDRPIEGNAWIDPPEGWDISPHRFSFMLAPGEKTSQSFTIRFDRDETAGVKTVNVHFELQAGKRFPFVVPLVLKLGTADIEAWGLGIFVGDRLIVRHGVTNLSDKPLSFRGYAVAPRRLRQYRVVNSIQPGRSTTMEYSFKNAGSLRGRTIRLQLREINGPRIHNIEVPIE